MANEHILLQGHVAWRSDYHEYFEIDNIPKSTPGARLEAALQRPRGRRQLPDAPERLLEQHHLASGSRILRRAGLAAPTRTPRSESKDCGAVPFKPTAAVAPRNRASDQPDGATTTSRYPRKPDRRNQHGRHQRRPRDAARRAHAQPLRGARAGQPARPAQIAIGTTHAVSCPPASRVGTVTIETDLPPKIAERAAVYLGEPRRRTDHGRRPTRSTSTPRASTGSRCACRARSIPTRRTGRLEATLHRTTRSSPSAN